jgi:carboxymethylenebutenolidase
MDNQIVVESPDGTFHAYISRPASLPAPVVVVLQELFGVNADIQATCDELAAQGFIAIAPDLFWRLEPDVDLDVRSEVDWQHGLRLYATPACAISRKQSAPLLSCPSRRGGLLCKATASAD